MQSIALDNIGEGRAQCERQALQSLSVRLTEHFGIGWSYSNLRQIRHFT